MADTLKQDFIDLVRLTPDGIQNFLETPIPTAPTIGTPADVDAAIIANGVAAKYILDLFNAYAGYTPIEGILRIGQHNSVLESAMLAGLEYIAEGPEKQKNFTVIEPEDGGIYFPGNLRLTAKAKNGTIAQIACEITGLAPVALESDDGITFYGFARTEELNDYAATFTALFDDDTTQAITVNFSISDIEADPKPEPPDGGDLLTLEADRDSFKVAVKGIGQAKVSNDGLSVSIDDGMLDGIANAANKLLSTGKRVASTIGTKAETYTQSIADKINSLLGLKTRALTQGSRSPLLLTPATLAATVGALASAVDAYYSLLIDNYWKNNTHPPTGYTSSPQVLRGAAAAMNRKYGAGTVVY
jgi:hypothetical protein